MFLKRLSFGRKECTEELKLECPSFFWARLASFGHLCLISDTLIISKFINESHDPKGQGNKIYTIVKGRETFYRRHTVPINSCSEVKYVLKKVMYGMKLSLNQVWDRTAALTGVSRSTAQKIVEEKKKVNYWASEIARDNMPEPVVIYLDSDDDDFATDTASENENET